MRWTVVLALATAVACGGQRAPVHHAGDEYLGTIRIEGNQAIPTDTLLAGLVLHRDRNFDRGVDDYQVARDAERIASAYQRLGYLSVDVQPRVESSSGVTNVIFKVTEGPRARTRIEVFGLPPDVSEAKVRELIGLREGAPFDYQKYDDAKAPVELLIEDAGYARARIESTVIADAAARLAIVRFVVEPGPKCTFGDVEISGASGELAEAIRARADFEPGEPYRSSVVADTQKDLYSMGRFSTVRVETDRSGTGTVIPIKIAVSLGQPNELRIGGGAGVDALTYQIRGRFQYTRVGFLDPLQTLSIDLKPAYAILRDNCVLTGITGCDYQPRVRAIAGLLHDDLFYPRVRGEAELGLDYLTLEAYTSSSARVRLGLASPLGTPRLQLRVGWQLQEVSFSNISPAIDATTEVRLGLADNERLGAYTQSLIVDLRDNPYEPRYGGYGEVRVAEGTRFAGGAFDYLQIVPDVRAFLPLGPFELAGRMRVGAIYGDVAVTERFYGGGASSMRGFAERRLSPTAMNTVNGKTYTTVIGGAALVETGGELRMHWKPWGLAFGEAIFLDGGDVTPTPADLHLDHLHWAVGVGLRYFFLPAPVRFDIAYRLNRYGAGEPEPGDRIQYFFSIGEAY